MYIQTWISQSTLHLINVHSIRYLSNPSIFYYTQSQVQKLHKKRVHLLLFLKVIYRFVETLFEKRWSWLAYLLTLFFSSLITNEPLLEWVGDDYRDTL